MKLRNIIIAILILFSVGFVSANGCFIPGGGVAGNPFNISTCEQLQCVGNSTTYNLSAYYQLVSNVNCSNTSVSGHPLNHGGAGFTPIGSATIQVFKGTLDGKGFNITGLYINVTATDAWEDYYLWSIVALFSFLDTQAVVKDLGLKDVNINANSNWTGLTAGGLAGSSDGYINNCFVTGNLTGNKTILSQLGGVVGFIDGGTVNNSYFIGNLNGNYDVGGLAGFNGGDVTNCHAIANVTGNNDVGGLIGSSEGSVYNSYSITNVNGTENVGGLIGDDNHIERGPNEIISCYSSGNVNGENNVGGLTGYSTGGLNPHIINSNSSCKVTGTGNNIGGLIGKNEYNSTIVNCIATGTVTGINQVGGLIGYQDSSVVNNCHAKGNVNGTDYVGGLIGRQIHEIQDYESVVNNSYATGKVTGTRYWVGGLIGYEEDSVVNNCYATGNISGNYYVGGLVGQNYDGGIVSNSYSVGQVNGSNDVGGLVGVDRTNNAVISNSYSIGQVNGGSNIGGLVGRCDDSGSVNNSYATGKVTGTGYVGGLIGYNVGSVSNSFWDKCRTNKTNCTGNQGTPGGCTGKNINNTAPNDNYFYNMSNQPMNVWSKPTIWSIQCSTTDGYPILTGLAGQSCKKGPTCTGGQQQETDCNTYCTGNEYQNNYLGGLCLPAEQGIPGEIPEFNTTALAILIIGSIGLFIYVRNPEQTKQFAKEHKATVLFGIIIIIGGTFLLTNSGKLTGFAIVGPTPPTDIVQTQESCGGDNVCWCVNSCPDNSTWNGTNCVNETQACNAECTASWQCMGGMQCISGSCTCQNGYECNQGQCEPIGECNGDNCEDNETCISYECLIDIDQDGYSPEDPNSENIDCNDTDPQINPGANENCENGIDDDCDGLIDMADPDCNGCEEGENWCILTQDCYDTSLINCTGFNSTTDCGLYDDVCELNDSCSCKECDGIQDHCANGLICDYENPSQCCDPLQDINCGCPPGMNWCNDTKKCYDPNDPSTGNCSTFNSSTDCGTSSSVCERGDSCSCNECNGEIDTCDDGAICDTTKDWCVCPYPTTLCLDNTCSTNCAVTDTANACTDATCQDGQVCIGDPSVCACPSGQTWNGNQCIGGQQPSGGGGGGGGNCQPNWECTEWSDCGYFSGTRMRTCTDTKKCSNVPEYLKPALTEQCRGIPACSDGLKNNGETGIDCGGKCSPCPTIASCSDNVQNQGETGVDCGGPCPACPAPTVEAPAVVQEKQTWWWLWLLLLLLAIILLIGGFVYYRRGRVEEAPLPPMMPKPSPMLPKPKVAAAPKVPLPPVVPVPASKPKLSPLPRTMPIPKTIVEAYDQEVKIVKATISEQGFNPTLHADKLAKLFKQLPLNEKTARFEEAMNLLDQIKKKV